MRIGGARKGGEGPVLPASHRSLAPKSPLRIHRLPYTQPSSGHAGPSAPTPSLSRAHTHAHGHTHVPRTPIGASLAPNSLLTCRCLPPGRGKADRTGVGENRCAESKIWQKNNNNKYFQSVNLTFFSSFKFR